MTDRGANALLQAFRDAGVDDKRAAQVLAEMFGDDKLAVRVEGLKIYTRVKVAVMVAVSPADDEFKKRMAMLEKLRAERANLPQ